jgi:hypothetical protein
MYFMAFGSLSGRARVGAFAVLSDLAVGLRHRARRSVARKPAPLHQLESALSRRASRSSSVSRHLPAGPQSNRIKVGFGRIEPVQNGHALAPDDDVADCPWCVFARRGHLQDAIDVWPHGGREG